MRIEHLLLLAVSVTPLSACTGAETTACDDAIKATLKAPSTYKRLKSGERRTETMSRRIDYEAVNSFNAPIRGSGECVFNSGHAYWYEDRT